MLKWLCTKLKFIQKKYLEYKCNIFLNSTVQFGFVLCIILSETHLKYFKAFLHC
jgi:hypothetical protein